MVGLQIHNYLEENGNDLLLEENGNGGKWKRRKMDSGGKWLLPTKCAD